MKNVERYRHIIPIIESLFATRGAVNFQYDGAGMKNSDFWDVNARIVGEIKHSGEIGYRDQIKRFWKDWVDKTPIIRTEVEVGFINLSFHDFSHLQVSMMTKHQYEIVKVLQRIWRLEQWLGRKDKSVIVAKQAEIELAGQAAARNRPLIVLDGEVEGRTTGKG